MSDDRTLAFALAELHPDEAAAFLESATVAATTEFLTALPAAVAGSVTARMAPAHAAASLAEAGLAAAVAVVAAMPPNAAASVLRRMPQAKRDPVLNGLGQARQIQVRLLLRQPPRSVGAWMDCTVSPVRAGLSAGAAKRMIADQAVAGTHLYVTDDGQAFLGSVAIADILSAGDGVFVERLYAPDDDALRAAASLDEAIGHDAWNARDELPVIDRQGRFVGAIRYAVIRQAITPPADLQDGAAGARDDGSIMDLADMCYVGMAHIMDGAISRRPNTASGGPSGGASGGETGGGTGS